MKPASGQDFERVLGLGGIFLIQIVIGRPGLGKAFNVSAIAAFSFTWWGVAVTLSTFSTISAMASGVIDGEETMPVNVFDSRENVSTPKSSAVTDPQPLLPKSSSPGLIIPYATARKIYFITASPVGPSPSPKSGGSSEPSPSEWRRILLAVLVASLELATSCSYLLLRKGAA